VQITSAINQPKRRYKEPVLSVAFKVYTKTQSAASVAEDALREYLPLDGGDSKGFLFHLIEQGNLDGTSNFTAALKAIAVTKEPDAGGGTGEMGLEDGGGSSGAIYVVVSAVVLALCFCICATVQVYLWLEREGPDGQKPTEVVMQELKAVRSRTRTGSQAYSSLAEEGGPEYFEEDDGGGDGDGDGDGDGMVGGRISMESLDSEEGDANHMAGGMPSIESLQPQRVDGVPVRVTIIEDGEDEQQSML